MTLISAALSNDSAASKAAAQAKLAPLLKVGPIDSVDQWVSLSTGGGGAGGAEGAAAAASAVVVGPRTELLLAGIDVDVEGAAIRVGDYKLLVGDWGPSYHAPRGPLHGGSLHGGSLHEGRSTRGSQIFFILTCAQY